VEEFPLPTSVLGIEVPFEMVLQHPITGETAALPLVGAMDVIAQYDTQRRVLEIKTGKRMWSEDQVDYDLQPTIYRKAAHGLGLEGADVELVVITKAKNPKLNRLPCARSQRDEIELVELALTVEKAVRAGVDNRRRDYHCRSCGYTQRCSP
jgi:predicted RecB family nuclease